MRFSPMSIWLLCMESRESRVIYLQARRQPSKGIWEKTKGKGKDVFVTEE